MDLGRTKEEVSGPIAGLIVGSKGDFRISGLRNWVSKACQLRWGLLSSEWAERGAV